MRLVESSRNPVSEVKKVKNGAQAYYLTRGKFKGRPAVMSPVKQNRAICTLLSRPPPLVRTKNSGSRQNTGAHPPIKFARSGIFSSQCAFPKSDSRDLFRQPDQELEMVASSSNRPGCSAHLETLRTLQQHVRKDTPKATETALYALSH